MTIVCGKGSSVGKETEICVGRSRRIDSICRESNESGIEYCNRFVVSAYLTAYAPVAGLALMVTVYP